MATVGREVLGSKRAFKRAVVNVPEWGGDVHIRELTAIEVARAQQIAASAVDVASRKVIDVTALARFHAAMIVAGWVDENGANELTDADIDGVLEQPSKVVALLSQEIAHLSGIELAEGVDALVAAKNG